MKNTILMLFLFVSVSTFAQEKKLKNAKFATEISGNCDHCKQRIEKTALSVSGVKSADWNVDTKKLTVIINEEKTSLNAVKKAIAAAGHDSDTDKTTEQTYNALPQCCQYERK